MLYSIMYTNLVLQLCDLIPGVISFQEIVEFFTTKWSPLIVDLHLSGGDTLSAYLGGLVAELREVGLQPFEVSWYALHQLALLHSALPFSLCYINLVPMFILP